ncbi:MAG: lysostaphin resistance A-like protein [Acutalibacteraceae bacterium]
MNNFDNMSIIQKQYDKSRLRWESNKIGFLIVIALVAANILAIAMQILEIIVSGNVATESTRLSASMEFASIFVMTAAFFVCPLIFCKISKIDLNSVLPFKRVKVSELTAFIFIGLAVCTLSNYACDIIIKEFGLFGISNNIDFSQASDDIGMNIIALLSTAVEPPLAEEFLFRGVILGVLRRYGDGFAVLMSSILFGLMHGNFVQIPFAFIVGLILSFVTVRANSLLPAILIHFFNNFLAVFYDILDYNTNGTTANFIYFMITIATVAIALLAVFLLCKNKRADEIMKLDSKSDDTLTFKEKVSCSLLNPGIIIFIALILLEAVAYLNLT